MSGRRDPEMVTLATLLLTMVSTMSFHMTVRSHENLPDQVTSRVAVGSIPIPSHCIRQVPVISSRVVGAVFQIPTHVEVS